MTDPKCKQPPASKAVLVVDDETHFLTSMKFVLAHLGIARVDTCSDSRLAMEMFQSSDYGAVFLDISMPYVTGAMLLKQMQALDRQIPLIMISAVNEVDVAVSCIKNGAFDYLLKPCDEERLATTLQHAFELAEVRQENCCLRETLTSGIIRQPDLFREFVTGNSTLIGVFSYIEAVARSRQPVLITGETGTGKELVARAVHEASGRPGEYVPVNVAGIAEAMLDDELFGHRQGAFTGAQSERAGMIEKAAGGTLFLDEIGDLACPMQVKLLRLIQEGQYQRLGSDEIRTSDARIVVATNLDIEEQVRKGLFRPDLYYRLCTHRVHLPPLRERKEDIPFLVDKFLEAAAAELRKSKPNPPRQLYTLLANYGFPGNVRELRSMVYDAVSLHRGGTLSMETFRRRICKETEAPVPADTTSASRVEFHGSLPTLKEIQELLIDEALKAADGNQTIAAGILGMSRRALNSRLSRQ
jgi:DNA-binding NtrC family response regulator